MCLIITGQPPEYCDFVDDFVAEMLFAACRMSEVSEIPAFISPLGAVPKARIDKQRPVIDIRHVNDAVNCLKFIFEGLSSDLKDILSLGFL